VLRLLYLKVCCRVGNKFELDRVKNCIYRFIEGLNVEMKLFMDSDRWVVVRLLGSDERMAASLLNEEVGVMRAKVSKGDVINGFLEKVRRDGVLVDIGSGRRALINTARLFSQLSDGREVEVKELARTFCLFRGIPLRVKIEGPCKEGFTSDFSEEQVLRFLDWIMSGLDRIVVLGDTLSVVKRSLRSTGLMRYIIEFERLGLLEHALTCRIGANSRGIRDVLRGELENKNIHVFEPRKAIALFGDRLRWELRLRRWRV
jgi:hypothetical protein